MIVNSDAALPREWPADAVVVVGSGAAGIPLSLSLADAGRPVILLESGGDITESGSSSEADDLNAGAMLGHPVSVATGRARILGGTTRLWHGQCMRLHDIDVDDRPWIPSGGWPIRLAELDKHYADAEVWLGVSQAVGHDRPSSRRRMPALPWNPALLLEDFTEYSQSPDLGRRYHARLAQHQRLWVVLHATAGRILVEEGRTVGIEVHSAHAPARTVPSDTVVLAAGAIENARLLMLSDADGIGLGTGRWHTGRWLQDHPVIGTAQVVSDRWRLMQERYSAFHRRGRKFFPKLRLSPDVQRAEELLDATAVFDHEYADSQLDAVRRLVEAGRDRTLTAETKTDLRRAVTAPVPLARSAWSRMTRGVVASSQPKSVRLQLWLEQAPSSASVIRLDDVTDVFGLRRPLLDWRLGDQEILTSRRFTEIITAEMTRLGLGDVHPLPPMQDDDAWRQAVTDGFHPAGTARMSKDPTDGVVDPDLQVHGVEGLFVVGSSAFRTSGYANPTLTITALALRLAERLAGRATAKVQRASA